MKRLQTPLRRTMTDERLSSLAISPNEHKDVNEMDGITEFACLKGTQLALCLEPSLLRHCFTLFLP